MDGILGESNEISYFHHDNLGSTRLMTNDAGEVTMDQDYMPFGGDLPRVNQHEVQNDENEGYKYTGQREVVSIGLYYYGARYYDPGIGRFITEDTWRGRLTDPQTQNTYIYTLNNPLKYIDPSGNTPLLPRHMDIFTVGRGPRKDFFNRKVDITLHVAYQRIIKQELERPVPPNLMSDSKEKMLKYAESIIPYIGASIGNSTISSFIITHGPKITKGLGFIVAADTAKDGVKYMMDRNYYEFRVAVEERFEYHLLEGNDNAEIEIEFNLGTIYVDGEQVGSTAYPLEWIYWMYFELGELQKEVDRHYEVIEIGFDDEFYYQEYLQYFNENNGIDHLQ